MTSPRSAGSRPRTSPRATRSRLDVVDELTDRLLVPSIEALTESDSAMPS